MLRPFHGEKHAGNAASPDYAVTDVSDAGVSAVFSDSRQWQILPLFIASPQVKRIGHHLIHERRRRLQLQGRGRRGRVQRRPKVAEG